MRRKLKGSEKREEENKRRCVREDTQKYSTQN